MPNALTIRGPTGDMHKSAYDADNDGIVDNSQNLENNSKAQVQDHTPKSHLHSESHIIDLDHDALKIAGVEINDAAKEDQASLIYDEGTNKIIYSPPEVIMPLNSLQHVSITIPQADDFASAVISPVDMDKTFLIYAGSYGQSTFESQELALIELIDSTHVRATRYLSNAEMYVNCHVVEFTAGIASIQRGVIDLTGQSQVDDTIDAVDIDKTFVSWLGILSEEFSPDVYCTRLTLLNSTTVRAYRFTNSGVVKISYEAVEFA